jgi:hypothetical protein
MNLTFVEDYLEFMAGVRRATGQSIPFLFSLYPPISLASYDKGFVEGVGNQLYRSNVGLTDKQAALCEKLIVKYAKQLAALGVDQPSEFKYRNPIRTVNRDKTLTLANDQSLHMKFPFDNRLISVIKDFAKGGQGSAHWVKSLGVWRFGLTEYNVSGLVQIARANHITVDPAVEELFDLIIEAEKIPYQIELVVDNNGVGTITNAADSMNSYVRENIGFDNFYKLVDHSSLLGFSLSDQVREALTTTWSEDFLKLCESRESSNISLRSVLLWAQTVGRTPVYIYNPNMSFDKFYALSEKVISEFYSENEIQCIGKKDCVSLIEESRISIDSAAKIIYTNTVLDCVDKMPLLVSYVSLFYGLAKRNFRQKAEKVGYMCLVLSPNK